MKSLQIAYLFRDLQFKFDARTSRGKMESKPTWLIRITDPETATSGIGECSPLPGLSPEYVSEADYKEKLITYLTRIQRGESFEKISVELIKKNQPSILFGMETALLDLKHGGQRKINSDTPFLKPNNSIPINGLIWMGDFEFMLEQAVEKSRQGFNCLKLKIGGIEFEEELTILRKIREKLSPEQLTIRLDANGAFSPSEALKKLERLSDFGIHSIEQPLKANQWLEMKLLCKNSPIPIALDEELIGIKSSEEKIKLLEAIKPPFVIFKPSLIGGLNQTEDWIKLSEDRNIGWWITSALESNVGLNAISQLTSKYQLSIPQGLGTGQLYHNNFESPLNVRKGQISYGSSSTWEDFDKLPWVEI